MADHLEYGNSILPELFLSDFLICCAAAAVSVFIIATLLLSCLKDYSVLGYITKLFMVYSVNLLYCNSLWNKLGQGVFEDCQMQHFKGLFLSPLT